MAGKVNTSGSSASEPGSRPRAQISYEGEDEFSTMSLDPSRKQALKDKQRLAPASPGEKEEVKVDPLKSTNENGVVSLLRRIFAR